MSAHFLRIVPVDAFFVPPLDLQIKACDFLANLLPARSGRWQDRGSIAEFPSLGDIDFTTEDVTPADSHDVAHARFSVTIDNCRDMLTPSDLSHLENLLGCCLQQEVVAY